MKLVQWAHVLICTEPESEFLSGKAEQSQLHRELDSRSGMLKI